MLYRYSMVVPADTPSNNPFSREIKLEPGIIHYVNVKFPPGCHQLVYFAIFQGANKQFPTNPSEWLRGDGEEIIFREHAVNKRGFHWYLKGYSPGTLFEHLITVRIGILPEEDVTPLSLIKDLVSIFKRMLGMK